MSKAQRVPRLETGTFLFICRDGEKTPPLREKHLFGHLDHIEANNDKYRVAGPMREGNDGPFLGSVFLVEANNEDEAWKIMRGDPYVSSDMYETVECMQMSPACGSWMGGIIWDQDEIRANIKKFV